MSFLYLLAATHNFYVSWSADLNDEFIRILVPVVWYSSESCDRRCCCTERQFVTIKTAYSTSCSSKHTGDSIFNLASRECNFCCWCQPEHLNTYAVAPATSRLLLDDQLPNTNCSFCLSVRSTACRVLLKITYLLMRICAMRLILVDGNG